MKGSITIKTDTINYVREKQVGPPSQIFTYLMDPTNKILKRVGGRASSIGNSGSSTNNFSNFVFLRHNQHSNFLYVYFWYAYYLLLVPFRFQKVGEGKFIIYQWLPQQILCGLSNILSILRLITSARTAIEEIRGRDPISFFMMFCQCSSFVFKATTFTLFWTKMYAFEKLINFLNCRHLVPYNPYKIESIKLITGFCGAYAVLSFLRMGFGSTFIKYKDWSPEWLYRRLVAEAQYTFFLVNSTSVDTAPELSEITSTDIFLTIVHGLSVQSRFITGFFVDLCILVHVLSLWAPASGFSNIICAQIPALVRTEKEEISYDMGGNTVSPSLELDVVLKQFEALKTLSILVGESIGAAIMPYIGEALFYYAIYFDSVVLTPDVVTRLVLMFFYISASCILMFSAEIVRKIRWLKTFLADQQRLALIDQNQLAVILDDLSHHSVGVTASGIFTINYLFVGTIVSVLITYFIIRLQTASLV